jgi:hypothetical protein
LNKIFSSKFGFTSIKQAFFMILVLLCSLVSLVRFLSSKPTQVTRLCRFKTFTRTSPQVVFATSFPSKTWTSFIFYWKCSFCLKRWIIWSTTSTK